MYLKMIFVSLLAICVITNAQQCDNKKTCHECITQSECAWCSEATENETQHCYEREKILGNCPMDLILDPESQAATIEQRPLATRIGSGEITQISPQYVKLRLRKNEEYTLGFQYAQAHASPVDLYYIMDLSASMANDKAHLAQNGKQLVETMQNVTGDFKIGFGSFVGKIIHPCPGCDPGYSYKNHMSLNSSGDEFSGSVDAAKISGNLDMPEGGFDALMQAMVCGREIGWRNNSRRIIVFATDAPFHVADNNKPTEILIPNEGDCHTVNGNSSATLKFDYPSISHINDVAKLNNFHILFVVKDKVKTLYKQLEKSIENSRTVDLDVNNQITNEIVKLYREISTVVKMRTNTSNVEFAADCNISGEYIKNEDCTNIVADQIIKYRATIKATRCGRQEPIRIKPATQDVVLQVDLKVICECTCGADVSNSSECNNHGDLHCGVCECHMGFDGTHCERNQQMGDGQPEASGWKMGNDSDNCSELKPCIECNVHSIGVYKDDCYTQCAQYTINVVPSIDETQVETVVCRSIDDDDCKLIFTYRYENGEIIADALGELQCSKPVNVLVLVLGICGGVLLVGIVALIACRGRTFYIDRQEYAKFKELKAAKAWDRSDNPLFPSEPTASFRN